VLSAVWKRCPVILRAVLTGLAQATIGTTPWALLASANLKHGSAVPWAVPPTALYLWLFWRYARGDGWPASTGQARRANFRGVYLSDDVWAASLVAGGFGLGTLVLLFGVEPSGQASSTSPTVADPARDRGVAAPCLPPSPASPKKCPSRLHATADRAASRASGRDPVTGPCSIHAPRTRLLRC
jgi:hypothetical protein